MISIEKKHSLRVLSLILWLCAFNYAYGSVTIEKTIYLTVGSSTTINPWSVVNSSYSGYSCISTKVMGISDNTALSVTTSSTTKTKYPTLYQPTGYSDGFYSTYKVKALKAGSYTLNTYVYCTKREGYMPTNYTIGDFFVLYHVVITEVPKVVSITIPNTLSLSVGDSYKFSPVIYEEGANTTLSWESSNSSVATIQNGTIKALSPGNTTITCIAANGVSAQCFVTVTPIYISSISLNKSELDLDEGDKYTLIATISPTNATNKDVEWSSTNNNIAIVGNNGTVVGISEGYCYITAYTKDGSNKSANCLVHVKKKAVQVESIIITPASSILKIGETTTLAATVLPKNATDVNLVWSSSDASVATVDVNGKVTAISVGEATIIVSANDGSGIIGTCKIIVSPILAESITIIPTSVTLKVGETTKLAATVLPQNTTEASLSWSSSNISIAVVNEEGVVSAVSAGNATITAMSNDGSLVSASCLVTIFDDAESGDVNDDGMVDISDVVAMVNHILGNSLSAAFNVTVADLNNDDNIDISDVVSLVNMILNPKKSHITCPDNYHPHMIDLGLPSGTKWACCNVGASSPEAYGGYYAWGETEEKDVYNDVTYTYVNGVDTDGDGWYDKDEQYQSLGSSISGTQYDVAYVKWGYPWVMPSWTQFMELTNNCSFEWTAENGILGGLFTGKNGNSIFFPATKYNNSECIYWSSTHNPNWENRAYEFNISNGSLSWNSGDSPSVGKSIRPVVSK